MPFARSTRLCAMPTIFRTMRVFPSLSGRRGLLSGLKHGMRHRRAGLPMTRSSWRCAMRRSGLRFRRNCWSSWSRVPRWTFGAAKRGEGRAKSSHDTYETFDELYRYCYLVASVVGLVCIRIFGYHDPRAEKLAEETGIAFQLTNILRDVREDAERGRIYLPLEDLRRFGVTPEQLAEVRDERGLTEPVREFLHWEALRAEEYYRVGRETAASD